MEGEQTRNCVTLNYKHERREFVIESLDVEDVFDFFEIDQETTKVFLVDSKKKLIKLNGEIRHLLQPNEVYDLEIRKKVVNRTTTADNTNEEVKNDLELKHLAHNAAVLCSAPIQMGRDEEVEKFLNREMPNHKFDSYCQSQNGKFKFRSCFLYVIRGLARKFSSAGLKRGALKNL